MNRHAKRARTIARMTVALLWLIVVASAGYTQARRPQEQYSSLPKLMKEGVHEQFTFISFTIFHNAPMDASKMRHLAKTASRLNQMAKRITGFKSVYEGEQVPALEAGAEELARAAEMLSSAAGKGSQNQFEQLFEKLETACHNCHAKFRKELAIETK